jgi:hypothetical protein
MPASKIVNIALIGRGFMGRTHSNAWSQMGKFFAVPLTPVPFLLTGNNYTYDLPQVRSAHRRLYKKIQSFELTGDADRFVLDRVRERIEFYITHFRLAGANKI